MCRNIRPLFNFDPAATEEEIRQASLQFVRKVSGFARPSKANEAVFLAAVEEIAAATGTLLGGLQTTAAAKNREQEAARAQARAAQRFGIGSGHHHGHDHDHDHDHDHGLDHHHDHDHRHDPHPHTG